MKEAIDRKRMEEMIHSPGKTAIIEFFATWCGHCKHQDPILDELAKEQPDKLLVGQVDVDKEPDLTSDFDVHATPTMFIFKDGKMLEKITGFHSKEKLLELSQL